jgi:hypothetical protein
MARPLRVQFSGALHHVTARDDERKPIFRGERDRRRRSEGTSAVRVCRRAGTPCVAISNRRLCFVGAGKVRFTYRDTPPGPSCPTTPNHDTSLTGFEHHL